MSDMVDFAALPDVDASTEEQDQAVRPTGIEMPSISLPPGHRAVESGEDVGTCPFAAIQAVLSQKSAEHAARPEPVEIAMQSTSLDQAIPEDFELSDEAIIHTTATTIGYSKMAQARQASFAGSKGAGSAVGSDASKSKMTRRTKQSKRSSRSGRSQSKHGQAARRTKKAPTFSSWEAQTYIPPIKKSWEDILAAVPLEDIGVIFYDKLFEVGGHSIEHMFTTEKSIMAVKFAEMLASIVGSVENPYSMYEKLKGLAPMHIEKGVGKEHLPIMGDTLFAVLELALKDKFTVQVRTAWEWLWAWLGATFTQSIEEAGNDTTVIAQSWNLAMDNFPDESLGELLYDQLFELAPNLRAVFTKPKQILSVKFVEMMSTLVSFHQKLDENYNEQLVWLGIRHVSYGAKFSHVDVLAEVLLATMQTACGDDWTEEMAECWRTLWVGTCNKLLSITVEAEQHGHKIQELWRVVQQRTTRQAFGAQLRRMLLSGTEWVQSLSSRGAPLMLDKKEEEALKGPKGKGKQPAADRRGSQVKEDARRKSQESTMLGSQIDGVPRSTASGGSPLPPGSEAGGEGGEGASKHSDAEAIGNQFWEMLTVILDLLWEPERQNEQLILMTTRFFKCGIRREHLDGIGHSLLTSCRKVLAESWSEEYKAAWDWFWRLVSCSMQRTFKVLEENHCEVVKRSWEDCKARLEVVDLGEAIFKELASLAPYVVHLFKRPKRIQAAQFVSAVDVLVSFLEDPDSFFVELKQLTIRHIKYGVKADYAKAFGTAVLRGVKNSIGKERWDAETQAAWEMLWDRVNNCLTRCLNAGTNLVIVALVNGDLEKAKEAMDCAPRGERFDTLTRVDVNGEVLSPVTWAIRDGMRDIALFLLEDLLSIRADRHAYYYGREKLFETHPDIVEVLCRDPGAEELMDTLFSGLMWHSNTVNNGKLRVNYYIKELYGDPRAEENVWRSALATLALLGPPKLFEHPVCVKLLETKWRAFGQKMFMVMQLFYVLITVLYYLGFVIYDTQCDVWGSVRLATGALALLAVIVQLAVALHQLRSGQTHDIHIPWGDRVRSVARGRLPDHVRIPRTLMNVWNGSRIVSYTLVSVVAFSQICLKGHQELTFEERHDAQHMLISIVALIVGLQLLEVFVLVPSVASLMLLVQRLIPDVARVLVLVLLLVVSFAGAISIMKEDHFDSFGLATKNIIGMLLELDKGLIDYMGSYGITVVTILVTIVQVCMFNVLVAQLVNRSALVAEWSELIVQKKFAYVCVEMESLLPHSYRCKLFDGMGFDQPLDFEVGDDGPSGGIQELEPASIRSHPKYMADRIMRFTGESSAQDPWPSATLQEEPVEEEYDD